MPESADQRARRISWYRKAGVVCLVAGTLLAAMNGFIAGFILLGDLNGSSWKAAAISGICVGLGLAVMGNYLWQKSRMI
jgi:hypothetical protein